MSIDVPRGPGAVWTQLCRIERHVEWMRDARRIEFVGDQREGVGTTFRCLTQVGPFRTTDVMRVTSWDLESRLGVEHVGVVTGKGEFTIEPAGDGTTLTWRESLRFPWWMGSAVGSWLAAPFLRWIWRTNLRAFQSQFID